MAGQNVEFGDKCSSSIVADQFHQIEHWRNLLETKSNLAIFASGVKTINFSEILGQLEISWKSLSCAIQNSYVNNKTGIA